MTSQFAVLRRADSLAEHVSPSGCAASRTGQAISDIHAAESGRPTRLTREPRSLPSSVRCTFLGKRPGTTFHLRVEPVKGTVLARLSSLLWLPSASRVTDRVTDPGSIRRGASGLSVSPAASIAATCPYASHPNCWAYPVWWNHPRCQDKFTPSGLAITSGGYRADTYQTLGWLGR
jgi:hypothetical protein